MRTAAIALGMGVFLLGVACIMLIACPSKSQALAMIVMLSFGAGLTLFGFLQVFDLTVKVSGVTATGAAAVFVLIYLVRPTLLTEISCSQAPRYPLPLRVVDAAQPTKPVDRATVVVQGTSTERFRMNTNGEGTMFFSDGALGQDLKIWATADGWEDSSPVQATLSRQMTVVELRLTSRGASVDNSRRMLGDRDSSVIQGQPSAQRRASGESNPFKDVFAIKAAQGDVSRQFALRFCKLGIVVNELRDCSYASQEACEVELESSPPGPYKSNHKCVTRSSPMFCYAQQTIGFSGDGRAQCYPDLASCQRSVSQLGEMSRATQPYGKEVCQQFEI